jgi:hypothetical protein
MTDDRTLERAARSWIEAGPSRAPDHVVEAALLSIQTTPQERGLRASWRFTEMSRSLRVIAGAAAVVVVAALALTNLSDRFGPTGGGQGPSSSPSTMSPTSIPASSPAALQDGPLTAGTYATNSAFPVPITVTVPDGWEGLETTGPTVAILQADSDAGEAYLGFWIVETAHGDPCNLGVRPDRVGPTVRDLAEALAGAPGFVAAGPTAVNVDGIAGEFVEITGPNPPCTEPELWLTPDGSCRCMSSSVERNRLWILEVDGNRLVIDALDIPASDGVMGTSAADLEELQAIIDSIQILR